MKSIFRLKKSVVSGQWSVVSPAASRQEGYTIIEMFIVLAIIALLLTVILTNYAKNRQNEILLNETYKVSQLIRRAQNLALSPTSDSVNGFGVYLAASSSGGNVVLFADNNSNNIYDSGESKEELALNSQVKISAVEAPIGTSQSFLNILYVPPDPTTAISNNATNAKITISLVDGSKSRTIEINATGLVEVK